jgi:hypothetical protein
MIMVWLKLISFLQALGLAASQFSFSNFCSIVSGYEIMIQVLSSREIGAMSELRQDDLSGRGRYLLCYARSFTPASSTPKPRATRRTYLEEHSQKLILESAVHVHVQAPERPRIAVSTSSEFPWG